MTLMMNDCKSGEEEKLNAAIRGNRARTGKEEEKCESDLERSWEISKGSQR